MKAYRVTSDNLDNALISVEDYKRLRLEMSSGDFGSHTAEQVEVESDEELLDLYEQQPEYPFVIDSIIASIHDTSFGGYPFKVTVRISIDVKEFNRLCPITSKSQSSMFGRRPARRDLGSLVVLVNNAVYDVNSNIPAHNPSIDSRGGSRARNGIKTMEFVYFFRDVERARALGFEFHKGVNSHVPRYGQNISIKRGDA